jgi:hypothetical protein
VIPYITYREEDSGELQFFVLQKAHPHYLGKVTASPKQGLIPSVPMAGYSLYIEFCGTLRGRMIPSYKDVVDEINAEMGNMATWYYQNRITADEKRYKKFKIQPKDSKPTQ